MLTTVEKVIFLQDIDIFEFTLTEDLSHIAAITDEIEYKADEQICTEGSIPDAMYMVYGGKVRLSRGGQELMIAGHKDTFSTWALFDEEPLVVTATAVEDTRLLRINKEDFVDLLADHVKITQSILKTMVKRLRRLMARAGG